ncbi:serine hydrolase domain-containing protein [Bacillus spongiae]|uniref:Serine hydrolase domain-containing protein n=1 Tax=Bacillus spongiae TaxID=2683610 RepID=A0ABU8HAW5_9BACI
MVKLMNEVQLHDVIKNICKQRQLPGLSICISDSSNRTITSATGVRSISTNEPLVVTDRLRAGSITKILIATLILKLQEQGIVHLEDTIEKHLPGILLKADKVTIRELLNHRSGLPDYIWSDEEGTKFIQHAVSDLNTKYLPTELIQKIGEDNLQFEPGQDYNYSNSGYILLGMIIEKCTGVSIQEALNHYIFSPLNLQNTYFPHEFAVDGPHAIGHSKVTNDFSELTEEINAEFSMLNVSLIWTAGALISVPLEINSMVKAIFEGHILSEESLNEMFVFQPINEENQYYGLGVHKYVLEDNVQAIGHQGGIYGFEAVTLKFLDSGLYVTVMINQMPAGVVSIAEEIVQLIQ